MVGLIVRSHEQPSRPRVVTEHPTCDPGLSIFPWAFRNQFCAPKADRKQRIFEPDAMVPPLSTLFVLPSTVSITALDSEVCSFPPKMVALLSSTCAPAPEARMSPRSCL
jgi:hypothetical protein